MAAPSIHDTLTALADPTRGRILLVLEGRELTVGELCTALQLPQSTASRHLKLLTDDGWLTPRGEGTSRFYTMAAEHVSGRSRELWNVVRVELATSPAADEDLRRAAAAVAKRQTRMRTFFANSSDSWDAMRAEMIGQRTELLALLELMDHDWVVGDLGCGAGHVAEALAPCVGEVIGVDESGPMLLAARKRLGHFDNVHLRPGHIESLPIENDRLDVAIMFLVAHFITDPAAALREVRRVLKPGGRVLIVDLVSHERADWVAQLGHVWQGFDSAQMLAWLSDAGFTRCRFRPLGGPPTDRSARNAPPSLFVASGVVRK